MTSTGLMWGDIRCYTASKNTKLIPKILVSEELWRMKARIFSMSYTSKDDIHVYPHTLLLWQNCRSCILVITGFGSWTTRCFESWHRSRHCDWRTTSSTHFMSISSPVSTTSGFWYCGGTRSELCIRTPSITRRHCARWTWAETMWRASKGRLSPVWVRGESK